MVETKMYDELLEEIVENALSSAEIIVPILIDLINPNSVIDIGCGLGAWLTVFQKHNIKRIIGIDGNYVDRNKLLISKENFFSVDLCYPFTVDERFDLAICLEVAEHLPRSSANGFICSITKLAPIILFSAAVPGQWGIHHVNNQWPDYWQDLFNKAGYLMLDPIRPIIWKDQRVSWYYRQNCFLVIKKSIIEMNNKYKEWLEIDSKNDMLLISRDVLAANLSLTYFIKRFTSRSWSIVTQYLKTGNK